MITKADKGNSIVILYIYIYINNYNKKVSVFISNNNFHKTASDITNRLQRDIRSTINECQNIIPKEKNYKYSFWHMVEASDHIYV